MEGSDDSGLPDRLVLIAIGLLVLLAPAVILTLTVAFLSYTGNLLLGQVSLLELLELYLIDLALLAVASYLLYRLLGMLVVYQLPESAHALEEDEESDEEQSESDSVSSSS